MEMNVASRRIQTEQRRILEGYHLTPRQKEALKWTAEGKTSWEVAVIMKCTEATVNYHLKTICNKLDAKNKTHAVYKAMLGQGAPHLDDAFEAIDLDEAFENVESEQ
jgi:DNA-binding CsgD family transcriptional regulator